MLARKEDRATLESDLSAAWMPKPGQRIAMREGNSSGTTGLSWIFADHLGSTSKVVKADNTLTSETRYKPWGEERYTSGSSPTSFGFTGQRKDSYINLIWYGSRWYDPALGRFISPDSIVPDTYDPLAYDRYAYVANNPLKYVDPSGHCWGVASGIRGLPSYDTTCNNLDMALTIVQSDQASAGEKIVAGAYIAAEGTAHLALVAGGTMLACSAVAPCVKAAESALGIGGAACADGDCTNEAQFAGNTLNAIRNMVGNAKGTAYEKWVQKLPGSEGNFKLPGAEYDNKIGNLLMEAKAFDWKNITPDSGKFTQFQNQVGRAYSVATQNGYQYVVRMLNKPPQFVINWLEKKGYDYFIE